MKKAKRKVMRAEEMMKEERKMEGETSKRRKSKIMMERKR